MGINKYKKIYYYYFTFILVFKDIRYYFVHWANYVK